MISAKNAFKDEFCVEFGDILSELPLDMPLSLKLSYLLGDTLRWQKTTYTPVKKVISCELYDLLFDTFAGDID